MKTLALLVALQIALLGVTDVRAQVWIDTGEGGDWAGFDRITSPGSTPQAEQCKDQFLGQVAVCRPDGCNYKTVGPDSRHILSTRKIYYCVKTDADTFVDIGWWECSHVPCPEVKFDVSFAGIPRLLYLPYVAPDPPVVGWAVSITADGFRPPDVGSGMWIAAGPAKPGSTIASIDRIQIQVKSETPNERMMASRPGAIGRIPGYTAASSPSLRSWALILFDA
jgi:hypothetical protein